MTPTHDVVIVGAGPAGSTAAHALASRGASVLVLDKAEFPRDKLCAGLLTWKAVDVLERVFGDAPEGLLATGVFNAAPAGYCIDVRLGVAVSAVEPESGLVRTADGREFRGRFVLGCDGVASVVRRACPFDGANWKAGMGGALEFYIDRDDPRLAAPAHADLRAEHPTVYAGFLRAGYGWVFPHADRLAIGIGGHSARHGREFRAKFREFVAFLGLPPELADAAKGHGLPYGNFIEKPWHGRVMLAGDAAGLVETLFGEGIYYALRSGELAAEAALAALTRQADPHALYAKGLDRDILPELVWSRKLRRVLYASQSWGFMPLLCFVRGGGRLLAEMVHGIRSYRFLLRRAKGPAA
jgi:flavin-dependent dehydrogenase